LGQACKAASAIYRDFFVTASSCLAVATHHRSFVVQPISILAGSGIYAAKVSHQGFELNRTRSLKRLKAGS
jgi:hypothetical protein